MCKKNNPRKIDKCMVNLIFMLKKAGYKVKACCCGHGHYNMSIIMESQKKKGVFMDIISATEIPRKKRFYIKDKKGYYYIPEVVHYIQTKTKVIRHGTTNKSA